MNRTKPLFWLILIVWSNSISSQEKTEMHDKKANALIKETSPYLLQHAYNPVEWHAWNDETLAKAKRENKLLLISIGYSSCHWCHVMEHESFENNEVAAVMNENFINVKVDREERPDVDQVYMTAVQLITGRGGWPLNCIAMPDGRPVWGGTYFRKDDWVKNISGIADIFENDPKQVEEYAVNLLNGIKQSQALVPTKNEEAFSRELADAMFVNMSRRFDKKEGGPNKAPKFPLPNNYVFLLDYAVLTENEKALKQVELTLDKMARGGIYDQIGGGFARYSTDELWKVPHFEKMLYDNAQLISLYSKAFQVFGKAEYKMVICETIEFLEREMRGKKGQFYSALDADSEGIEGKFYIWKPEELKELLNGDYPLFEKYYNVNELGEWEHNYILLRDGSDSVFAKANDVTQDELEQKTVGWKKTLLKARTKRIRPGLDDKALTSWNAMMIKAYAEAYVAINEDRYLKSAITTAEFIAQNLTVSNGELLHSYKDNVAKIDGFLEDYALLAEAYLALYQVCGDEKWLNSARSLVDISIQNFKDPKSAMFFFVSAKSESLVAQSIEKDDNVIPSSNGVMASNMHSLSFFTGNTAYAEQAEEMLQHMQNDLTRYPEGYTQWGQLLLKLTYPSYEVAVAGKGSAEKLLAFRRNKYYPNVLWAFADKENGVDLLQERWMKDVTYIYVCQNQSCQMPVEEVERAIDLITYD